MYNIGLIGFGAVGKSFVGLLNDKKNILPNIRLKYIIKSNGGIYNKEGIDLEKIINYIENDIDITSHPSWSNISLENILNNKDIDTLIELTSTNIENGQPGYNHIKKSLENNINVVTGNKGPILLYYKELNNLASKNNLNLKIGCTTGGALPSVNAGTIDVLGANVLEMIGVLNGTTNFILEKMLEKNIEYEDALKIAQDLKIAEKDPSLDVLGYDSAIKMAILSKVIWNIDFNFNDLDISGITNVRLDDLRDAKYNDKKIKLIAKASYIDNEFCFKVSTESIDNTHPLYFVDSKNKGVYYQTDILGDLSVIGGASSPLNAAASILRDLLYIIK